MRTCKKCGYKFTVHDRIKAIFNISGKLKCKNCRYTYKKFITIFKILYYILLSAIVMVVFYKFNLFKMFTLKGIIILISGGFMFFLFDLIARKIRKFKEFN